MTPPKKYMKKCLKLIKTQSSAWDGYKRRRFEHLVIPIASTAKGTTTAARAIHSVLSIPEEMESLYAASEAE